VIPAELTPGLLFLWPKYEHQNDGIIKDRYFLFLGETNDIIDPDSLYYLVTGTSLCNYYDCGEDRENSCHVRFKAFTHGLPVETVFDFDLNFNMHYKHTLNAKISQMIKISIFSNDEIAVLFNKLNLSDRIPHHAKKSIQSGLSQLGIPNLNTVATKRKKKYSQRTR